MKKIALLISILVLSISILASSTVAFADQTEKVNNTYKDTYELDTGIINYASITAFIDNAEQLNDIKLAVEEGKTPAMVYLRVKQIDGVLKVVAKDGAILTSLTDVLNNYTGDTIIPAFYLENSDTDTASVLQRYIIKHNICDAFVVSSDADLLASVIIYKNSMGTNSKLQVGGMLIIEDCAELSLAQINSLANKAKSRAVLVNAKDFSKERTHTYATDHALGYSISIYLKTDGVSEMQSAVLDGARGICTDDWRSAINFMESIKRNTYVRPINIIAHRGMDTVYQENTIEGIVQAAYAGVASIEIDPRLTKDKKIVLMHDGDIHRVTGLDGKVNDYTLEQLKVLAVNVNSNAETAPICTLEDVFVLYTKLGLNTPLNLDAKETNIEYFQILYDLIEEYSMWGNIASIGVADTNHSAYVKQMFSPKLPHLYDKVSGVTAETKETWQLTIDNWITLLSSSASGVRGNVSPYYTRLIYSDGDGIAQPEVLREATDRAIAVTPYQFDNIEHIEEAFFFSMADFSTGNSDYLRDFIEILNMDKDIYEVAVGDEVELTGKTITIDGTETNVKCLSYLVVDGDESVIEVKDRKVIAQKEGAITLRMKTTFTKANIEYDVYSNLITITVGDGNSQTSQNPTIGENINNSGCNGSIAEQTIIFTPVLLCVYIVAILKKKVKDNG